MCMMQTVDAQRHARIVTGVLTTLLTLPVAGYVMGRIAATSDDYDRWITGLTACVFAFPFMGSVLINLGMWRRRPPTTHASRVLVVSIDFVIAGAVAWLAGIFAPDSIAFWLGVGSGGSVAVGSIVVCIAIDAARRKAPQTDRERQELAAATRRKNRRDLLVAGAVAATAVAAGVIVTVTPTGTYEHCRANGYAGDADSVNVSTENCGYFELIGVPATDESIDPSGTYTFTTRGHTILGWNHRVVTYTKESE